MCLVRHVHSAQGGGRWGTISNDTLPSSESLCSLMPSGLSHLNVWDRITASKLRNNIFKPEPLKKRRTKSAALSPSSSCLMYGGCLHQRRRSWLFSTAWIRDSRARQSKWALHLPQAVDVFFMPWVRDSTVKLSVNTPLTSGNWRGCSLWPNSEVPL